MHWIAWLSTWIKSSEVSAWSVSFLLTSFSHAHLIRVLDNPRTLVPGKITVIREFCAHEPVTWTRPVIKSSLIQFFFHSILFHSTSSILYKEQNLLFISSSSIITSLLYDNRIRTKMFRLCMWKWLRTLLRRRLHPSSDFLGGEIKHLFMQKPMIKPPYQSVNWMSRKLETVNVSMGVLRDILLICILWLIIISNLRGLDFNIITAVKFVLRNENKISESRHMMA